MNKKAVSFLENLVILAIVLVLIQTFLEDFAVLMGFSWSFRKILIITGFGFDLFFTLEFLIRFYSALSLGRLRTYMTRGQGWIDLIASVPLVILNSGPAFLSLIAGSGVLLSVGGILNILKIVKTVRIARILRLLRVLKIFRQIKNVDSVSAQRHLARITAHVITGFVFTVFLFSLLGAFLPLPQADRLYAQRTGRIAGEFPEAAAVAGPGPALEIFTAAEPEILLVRKGEATLFSRFDNGYFHRYFGPGDYTYLESGGYSFFFDLRGVSRQDSLFNLMYFFIVVILTGILLLVYSPHFAMTVTDPIHVMRRGLEEKQYNYQVKILEKYADDDVFRLADSYNRIYLTLKDRENQKGEKAPEDLALKMEDLGDLFG